MAINIQALIEYHANEDHRFKPRGISHQAIGLALSYEHDARGFVTQLGKYEGDSIAVIYFEHLANESDADKYCDNASLFITTYEEQRDLGVKPFVVIWADEQGFIGFQQFTSKAEAETFLLSFDDEQED